MLGFKLEEKPKIFMLLSYTYLYHKKKTTKFLLGLLIFVVLQTFPLKTFAGGFEIKTSQGTLEPKENKRSLALPKAVLQIALQMEYRRGLVGFNNHGLNNCDPIRSPRLGCRVENNDTPSFLLAIPDGNIGNGTLAHNQINQASTRLQARYGVTNNFMIGFDVPLVFAQETYKNVSNLDQLAQLIEEKSLPERKPISFGDTKFLMGFQLLNTKDEPKRSLFARLETTMPVGNDSPGSESKLVLNPDTNELEAIDTRSLLTGTGTYQTDVGVFYKQQLGKHFAVTTEFGYILRFSDFVSYLSDGTDPGLENNLLPSAKLKLGDQIYLGSTITFSPSDLWFAKILVQGKYWNASRVARPPLLSLDSNTIRGLFQSETLFPKNRFVKIPNSKGFLLSATPQFTIQLKPQIALQAQFDLHIMGQNTNYVLSNTDTQSQLSENQKFGVIGKEENNFFPLEVLGSPLGSLILGTSSFGIVFVY